MLTAICFICSCFLKNDKVICALSGGVDSSVVALLINKAIKVAQKGDWHRVADEFEDLEPGSGRVE